MTSAKPEQDRERHRAIVSDCAALVALLREWNPTTSRPKLNASDREVGAYFGKQDLIECLELLLLEARGGTGDGSSLPKVL